MSKQKRKTITAAPFYEMPILLHYKVPEISPKLTLSWSTRFRKCKFSKTIHCHKNVTQSLQLILAAGHKYRYQGW